MKKILVPIDFSEVSEAAVHFALDLAKKSKASITLLNSARMDYFNDYQYPVFANTKSFMEEATEALNQRMERAVNEHKGEIEVSGKVSHLGLLEAIKEEIRENEIDLCVMGTNGSSGLEELFVGSNTERVVRYVSCPVISVPQSLKTDKIKKILVPIDLRELRHSFMKEIVRLQKLFNCELEFAWVKTPHNIENEEMVAKELKSLFEKYELKNYSFFIVKNVFPSDGILMEAEDSGADMVAMATHARRGIAHWLSGSLTEDTVNHIEVPVWSFRINKEEQPLKLEAVNNAKGKAEYKKIHPLTE